MHPSVTLLQYVDNLFLTASSKLECWRVTENLLEKLGQLGSRTSARKAQTCKQTVTYLGYSLTAGMRWLTDAMKKTTLRIPAPTNPREVRELLGTAEYYRLWIPSYAELAKPLYKATKGLVLDGGAATCL